MPKYSNRAPRISISRKLNALMWVILNIKLKNHPIKVTFPNLGLGRGFYEFLIPHKAAQPTRHVLHSDNYKLKV